MNIEQRIDKGIKSYFYELPEVEDITVNTGAIRQFLMNLKNEFNTAMPKNDQVKITNRSIAGPYGEGKIPLRVYSPVSEKKNLPALLWFHGGGFILGSLETDHYWCTTIAHEVQCTVISVDYRLAPEHPFPAGVEDCYAALEWVWSLAGNGDIDKKRVAVGGASAGGNMAAAVSLMARDRKGPELAFQLLIYPCLDDRHITPSSQQITDRRVWHRQMSLKAWAAYLVEAPPGDVPVCAAPSRVRDLSGLPPAYVTAAGLDLLRDEDIDYATRLMQAGVPTELHVFPGVIHGFEFFFYEAAVSRKARSEYLDVLNKAFI